MSDHVLCFLCGRVCYPDNDRGLPAINIAGEWICTECTIKCTADAVKERKLLDKHPDAQQGNSPEHLG